jgi:hypothetical protein
MKFLWKILEALAEARKGMAARHLNRHRGS